jgi:hypothetical protein
MWISNIPAVVAAGTTVKWRDDSATVPFDQNATSTDGWTLKYYLRSTSTGAHTVTGTSYNSGFEFNISSTDSSSFVGGDWTWEAVISKGDDKFRLGVGEFEVKDSLSYSGTVGPVDIRSQNEIDRDNIEAALRKFNDGMQEYSIGGRSYKRIDMDKLRVRLHELNAIVFREKDAKKVAQGLGSGRTLYTRF